MILSQSRAILERVVHTSSQSRAILAPKISPLYQIPRDSHKYSLQPKKIFNSLERKTPNPSMYEWRFHLRINEAMNLQNYP